MVLLADVGGLTGVRNTLNSILVPPQVIEEIMAILQQESDHLTGGTFPPVPPAAFGDRFSGRNLGTHTSKAHACLNNSVLEAVASLQGTYEAIEQFDRDLENVDVSSQDATTALLRNTQRAVDQLDSNPHTPPAQPPTGSDQ
jgi:hypothetical protein